ncbi:MAG: 4-(cytidine 5'-diphospho)-2-C-methyl-D-erythritol kinase [Methylovulum sp.]|jgi:4-diphosphocytidyl-2-C-methyl-D-erythritol kinase|nr:4-(cytidine 5'-diphospho)-2-C-methyl-D-erythritol kinase [Methylovulum sp.]MCF7997521.1 4-(cytidine 5'-diphospho)-2-C-methyl-D-erythritol kinase [Methylovulum sp.]
MQNDHSGWGRKWPAPAKLNLMLRIVGRRPDGYHLLQTVFQFVELSDMISFYPSDNGLVTRLNTLVGVPEQDDLMVRAANLLKSETGCALGVKIEIDKHIPMGGGLGGGSSDAATVLVILNKLWDLNLSKETLMQLGLRLGADVPIFVYGHAAWAEGVGEKVVNIYPKEQWVVLIKPECHVNTAEIFSTNELTRDSESITISDFMAGQQRNDCLDVVCQKYPSVKRALAELSKYSEAKLTGTGACVFAQFDSEESAVRAFQSIAITEIGEVFLTKSVNESPLLFELGNEC